MIWNFFFALKSEIYNTLPSSSYTNAKLMNFIFTWNIGFKNDLTAGLKSP